MLFARIGPNAASLGGCFGAEAHVTATVTVAVAVAVVVVAAAAPT